MKQESVEYLESGGRISIATLARCFDLGRDTIQRRLTNAGVRPHADASRNQPAFPLIQSIKALLQSQKHSIEGRLTEEQAEGLPPGERKLWFESEKKRIEVAKEKGGLVDADDVRQQYAEIIKIVVAIIDGIPYELERDCGLTPEQVADVENKLDQIRNDLAARLAA